MVLHIQLLDTTTTAIENIRSAACISDVTLDSGADNHITSEPCTDVSTADVGTTDNYNYNNWEYKAETKSTVVA